MSGDRISWGWRGSSAEGGTMPGDKDSLARIRQRAGELTRTAENYRKALDVEGGGRIDAYDPWLAQAWNAVNRFVTDTGNGKGVYDFLLIDDTKKEIASMLDEVGGVARRARDTASRSRKEAEKARQELARKMGEWKRSEKFAAQSLEARKRLDVLFDRFEGLLRRYFELEEGRKPGIYKH